MTMGDATAESRFGQLRRVDVRSIWPHEASDFTPWLVNNLDALGDALGLDLELEKQEADVGDFSLDILAKDLGSGRPVVIENQFSQTDHDHLGKLLTYAAGFDAGFVVWIAEKIREEHRQALDWLNQRTDTNTEFFAVVVEVLQIDDSRPGYKFAPIVFPNEWQKDRRTVRSGPPSRKAEAYREFFQELIDELREEHSFTGARAGQPQNWYLFATGSSGIKYGADFALNDRVRVYLYIDTQDGVKNKNIFDTLHSQATLFESKMGTPLEWERLDDKRASRIAVYRDGSIESDAAELEDIHRWCVQMLLKIKEVFGEDVLELVRSSDEIR